MNTDSQPLLGSCSKRSTKECSVKVDSNSLCDFFEPTKKNKYDMCCRDCKYFVQIRLIASDKMKNKRAKNDK